MEQLVSNEQIMETKAFKKMEKVFKTMVLKYQNKKAISQALIVFNSTGVVPGSIGGNNKRVLLDIISNQEPHRFA